MRCEETYEAHLSEVAQQRGAAGGAHRVAQPRRAAAQLRVHVPATRHKSVAHQGGGGGRTGAYRPDGVRGGEHGVRHVMQRRLQLDFFGGGAFAAGARARVLHVVRRARAAGVPTLELIFPEL